MSYYASIALAVFTLHLALLCHGHAQELGVSAINDGLIELKWDRSEEVSYFLLEHSLNLENSSWENLTRYKITESNGNYVATVAMDPERLRGFYRIAKYTEPMEVIDLVSIEQLEDTENIGKTIQINTSFNLSGQTIEIPAGIFLLPAGGVLSNGTIEGEGFTILTTAKNRIFNSDLKFAVPYSQVFLPEWYGARADGVTDDSLALRCSIEASEKVELWTGRNYLLGSPVAVNRAGTVHIDGKDVRHIGRLGDAVTAGR